MRKTIALLLAFVLCFGLVACGGSANGNDKDEEKSEIQAGDKTDSGKDTTTVIAADGSEVVTVVAEEEQAVKDIVCAVTTEQNTWCQYNSANKPGIYVNFCDPLLTVNSYNQLQPCLAEDYSCNADETVWTFKLRKGVTWVDVNGEYKADVTSEDWLYGLEWVLNFWKNDSYQTTLPMSIIEGAKEYYEYTQSLSEEKAWALGTDKLQEMGGIETPDEYTVVYNCINSCPYFASLATCIWMYPVSGEMLEEVTPKGYKSITPKELWYCGPYIMTEYVEDSTKTMVPNEAYWDDSVTRFDSVTYKKVESQDIAWELFQQGEINNLTVGVNPSNATLNLIKNDPSNEYYDYLAKKPDTGVSWFIAFNYAKKTADGSPDTQWNTAVANENFRKAFYYGMDLYDYFATAWDSLDPESCARGTMTVYGLAKLSDGTDYTDLVYDAIDYHPTENYSHQDLDKLAEYKAAAMEELSAQGVSFPITIDVYHSSAQANIDNYTILKEIIEDNLGTDFVKVELHSYITSKVSEVYEPSLMSMEIQGFGALYNDPTTFLTQLANDMLGNAEYADMYGHIADCTNQDVLDMFDTYTKMVRDADAITGDHDARYKALAAAETYAIEHAMIIPTATNAGRTITNVNFYSMSAAINDTQSGRLVNWETNVDNYTKEEIQIIRDAYLAVSGSDDMTSKSGS